MLRIVQVCSASLDLKVSNFSSKWQATQRRLRQQLTTWQSRIATYAAKYEHSKLCYWRVQSKGRSAGKSFSGWIRRSKGWFKRPVPTRRNILSCEQCWQSEIWNHGIIVASIILQFGAAIDELIIYGFRKG